MNCPFCGHPDTRVTNSRVTSDGDRIRRRRRCPRCNQRFTTYEAVERGPLMVTKRDGTREEFNRQKIIMGLMRACNKRPISREQMERIGTEVERKIASQPDHDVTSKEIGELILERLRTMDEVAYVRFMSVYREFKDIGEFQRELRTLSNGS